MRYYSFILTEDTTPPSTPKPPSTPPTNPLKTGNASVDAARQRMKQQQMQKTYDNAYKNNKAGVGGTVAAGLGGATIGLGTGLVHAAGSAMLHPIKTITGKNNLLGKIGAHMGIGAAAAGAGHVITTNNKAKQDAKNVADAKGKLYDQRIMQKNQKLNSMKTSTTPKP